VKKVFIVLEPEEIVKLEGVLMDHDGEEAWEYLQFVIYPKIKKTARCLDGNK
jgi:hypothetical protein